MQDHERQGAVATWETLQKHREEWNSKTQDRQTLRNGKTMTKTKQEVIICVEPGTWDLVEMSLPTHCQALLTGLSPSFPVHCVWRGWIQYLVGIFRFVWE